jgi:hypothetical protein
MTTLDRYNKLADELGITEEMNVPPVARLGFAREQATQMKSIVNRLLFDLTMAYAAMEKAKDENTVAAYKDNISKHERELRQTRDGLVLTNELVTLLEEIVAED